MPLMRMDINRCGCMIVWDITVLVVTNCSTSMYEYVSDGIDQ